MASSPTRCAAPRHASCTLLCCSLPFAFGGRVPFNIYPCGVWSCQQILPQPRLCSCAKEVQIWLSDEHFYGAMQVAPPDSEAGLCAAQAVDAVAGKTTAVVAASVRNNGEVLVYGALAGFTLELGVADLLFRNVRVHGFWCASLLFVQRVLCADGFWCCAPRGKVALCHMQDVCRWSILPSC